MTPGTTRIRHPAFTPERRGEHGSRSHRFARTDLEIVVPVFNEEERIGDTLRHFLAFLERQPFSSAVTVVDNGSTDRTAEIVDTLRSQSVPSRLLGCADQGKGAAVRRGILATKARYVGFSDADLATPIETLETMVPLLDGGHPIVIGSRRCEGASYEVAQPLARRCAGAAFRRVVNEVVDDVADTQCGFKFFRADVARELFGLSRVNGFAFDVELLAIARTRGWPITEVPVAWSDHAGSSLSILLHGGEVLRDLQAIRGRRREVA